MSLVADRDTNRPLNPMERDVLERIRKMRPDRLQRFARLVDMYRDADTEEEANEIAEVLAELLFGEPKHYTASKLDSDDSAGGREALDKHRQYVGEQIKKCRQRLHMSQEELAKRAGIPQSHVCRLETGKHAPTYLTIEKLASALGVRASELDPGFDD
jgi:ribosome-binding protein aMBF1 (putative translation factor)